MLAVGHDILLAAWFILACDMDYQDLGADYFDMHVMDSRHKATVCTLGVVGTTADRRIVDAATVTPFAPPRLTEPSVTRALRSPGISGMAGKGDG